MGEITVQQELEHCEAVIERGLQTFVEVGNALLTIRDKRLYRATEFRTFEAYCQERWEMTKDYANKLIASANVIDNVNTIVSVLPANEAQARPLTRLEPDQQREAWQRVVETVPGGGKITAAHVEAVVKKEFTAQEEIDDLEWLADDYVFKGCGTCKYGESDKKDWDRVWCHKMGLSLVNWTEHTPCDLVHWLNSDDDAIPSKMAVHFSSETVEHYTPQEIIDATLDLLNEIDLDPCSNSKEQPNIPARQHFTIEDDGLTQEWHGRIYMNPPYGREIEKWVARLCSEHEAGRVTEAIALVPSRTDTKWWVQLRDYPVCLVEGRLKFSGDNSAPFPSAIFYLGNDIDRFFYSFTHLGDIWQRLEPGMFGQ